jgi:hypothetical protein
MTLQRCSEPLQMFPKRSKPTDGLDFGTFFKELSQSMVRVLRGNESSLGFSFDG